MLFFYKNWLRWFRFDFTLCFTVLHVFLHSPAPSLLSEFYPPISSPLFLSSFIFLTVRSKQRFHLDRGVVSKGFYFASFQVSSSIL